MAVNQLLMNVSILLTKLQPSKGPSLFTLRREIHRKGLYLDGNNKKYL